MIIMDRKKAKQLIFLYKSIDLVLNIIIGILSIMIIPITCNMFFKYPDTKIPFVVFIWILYIFGGYSIFMRIVFKKKLYLYYINIRKKIKYIILPLFTITIITSLYLYNHIYLLILKIIAK